jgi:predicted transcriptional regulator of viral defense system
VKQELSRWKKSGLIAPLRKGLYELLFPERRALSDLYLANRIYAPSYISLETALSHYSLIPEVSMAVLSVTSKLTRQFKNDHGLFIYRSVQPKAFSGTVIENHRGFDVLIAEPEKALADWLYFKTLRSPGFDLKPLRLDPKRAARLHPKKIDRYGRLYGMNLKGILHAD